MQTLSSSSLLFNQYRINLKYSTTVKRTRKDFNEKNNYYANILFSYRFNRHFLLNQDKKKDSYFSET